MALGVLAMSAAIYFLFALLEQRAYSRYGDDAYAAPALFQPGLFIAVFLGTAFLVSIASGARTLSLRGGGSQIAEMMGGRLVSGNPQDSLEKRLLNVIEEMAIASGIPVPQVYVLENEPGINAFAAGFTPADAAIAVTRGCLEKLTREELQGVIGHEFSHVLNGDMRLNIRLMGIVFGIVCIGLLGRLLLRVGANSTMYRSSRRDRDSSPGMALFLAGLGLLVIGGLGEFFGKLIKAAVSRQREFLADASAVQFTRNPHGIAGALMKIGGFSEGARVHAANADEASHFFFGDIHTRLFDGSMLATHPPLRERIVRIEPSFKGEFPEVGPGIAQPDDAAVGVQGFATASAGNAAAARDAAPAAVVDRIGQTDLQNLAQSRRMIDDLPAQLREVASSPFSACAIVYALLLSDENDVRALQRQKIDALTGARILSETERLAPLVAGLPARDRLPLVSLLAPALRQLSREQRGYFTRTVQALIDADQQVSIFEYVLGQSLKERLSDDRAPSARSAVRFNSLRAVHDELELLLSLLAHAGADDDTGAETAFEAASARLPDERLHLLPASERLLSGLSAALGQLRSLAPQLQRDVVDACAHAVLADRRVTDDEATLLCAICDALGCPLPPFAASAS
jgi:Zn-dependent protease with chaperone function